MPGLPRNAKRLLRQVDNKAHATDDDHEALQSSEVTSHDNANDQEDQNLSKKNLNGTDIRQDYQENDFGDPIASCSDDEDDYQNPSTYQPNRSAHKVRAPKVAYHNIHAQSAPPKKRKVKQSDQESDHFSTQGDSNQPMSSNPCLSQLSDDWITSTGSSSQKKVKGYGSSSQKSIGHVKTPPRKDPKKLKTLSHGLITKTPSPAKKKILRKPPVVNTVVPAPTRKLLLPLQAPSGSEAESDVNAISDAELLDGISSPPSEVEVVELQDLHDPSGSTVACQLCGEQVDQAFVDDFELEQCHGKRMNIRMQERFCQAHKARIAQQIWSARSYPQVDWERLEDRMKRHRAQLEAIIERRVRSRHREELERQVQHAGNKTILRGMKSGNTDGVAAVGYYGARGAQMMTDYILNTMSQKLRASSGSDKLVGAIGVAGGVSGYVHSVLVPELAILLVMQDCNTDEAQASKIIKESTDIGALLNEAQRESVEGHERSDVVNLYD